MKKILVLSYFFPPCNLTASERVQAYALYFKELGYYPVIVTRNWDIPVQQAKDEHKSSGTRIIHEKHETYEVYYIPFRATIKNRLFEKLAGTRGYFLYLIAAFFYNIAENFTSACTPYLPLYNFCKTLLKRDKQIGWLLISGGPFHLFKFGYKLNRLFSINWIADYRDDWNTFELFSRRNIFKRFIQSISKRNEKKWVGSSSFFISVSDRYVQKIQSLHNSVPGYTILNGYIAENYHDIERRATSGFTVAYAGSLFPAQRIHIFLNAFKRFMDAHPEANAKMLFLGLKEQALPFEQTRKLVQGFERSVEFTLRLPKKEVIAVQYNAHVLLSCAHLNLKGAPGSKLYEYIALRKPVLVCPTDGDIIEQTLMATGQGYFANDETDAFILLEQLYRQYGDRPKDADNINDAAVKSYSRFENVKKLVSYINQHSE